MFVAVRKLSESRSRRTQRSRKTIRHLRTRYRQTESIDLTENYLWRVFAESQILFFHSLSAATDCRQVARSFGGEIAQKTSGQTSRPKRISVGRRISGQNFWPIKTEEKMRNKRMEIEEKNSIFLRSTEKIVSFPNGQNGRRSLSSYSWRRRSKHNRVNHRTRSTSFFRLPHTFTQISLVFGQFKRIHSFRFILLSKSILLKGIADEHKPFFPIENSVFRCK